MLCLCSIKLQDVMKTDKELIMCDGVRNPNTELWDVTFLEKIKKLELTIGDSYHITRQ